MDMEEKELTLHEKCENLMNVVVETRKRFGKMCVEYEHKTSTLENKILNLQLEYLARVRFKPKYQNFGFDVDGERKEMDNFVADIKDRENRIENLRRNLKNTEQIVLQLKDDKLGLKIKQPLSAEARLRV